MARVKCSVPSVSEGEINGVAFAGEAGGLLSAEVTQEVAEAFAAVPGYEIVVAPETPAHRLPGDTKGDGKLSAAEKRTLAKRAAAAAA
jgi:hypothetical protein